MKDGHNQLQGKPDTALIPFLLPPKISYSILYGKCCLMVTFHLNFQFYKNETESFLSRFVQISTVTVVSH